MTPELVAILAVGVALAAFGIAALQLLCKQFEAVRVEIDLLRTEIKAEINSLRTELKPKSTTCRSV